VNAFDVVSRRLYFRVFWFLLAVTAAAQSTPVCSKGIVNKLRDATVFIQAKRTRKLSGVVETRYATGFIVSPSGFVLTDTHTIAVDSETDDLKILGAVHHRGASPLELVEIDTKKELALLKFKTTGITFPAVNLGTADVQVRTELCSEGFPEGQEWVAPSGALTGTGGDRGFWITQMPSNPGESGAPVFLPSGEVVGIKFGGYDDKQLLNLVIPINFAHDLLAEVGDLPRPASQVKNQVTTDQLEQARAIAVMPFQLQEVKNISELLDGKSELELRNEFGFEEMFHTNVAWLFASYRHQAFKEPVDWKPFPGMTLMVMEGGEGQINLDTGELTPKVKTQSRVKYLLVPSAYTNSVKTFRTFSESPFLSDRTKTLMLEYLDLANTNILILGDVFEKATGELSVRYPKATDHESEIWIYNKWVYRFRDLKPKAEEIQKNLGNYVKADDTHRREDRRIGINGPLRSALFKQRFDLMFYQERP